MGGGGMFTKECKNLSSTEKKLGTIIDISLTADFYRGTYRDVLIPASNSGAADNERNPVSDPTSRKAV